MSGLVPGRCGSCLAVVVWCVTTPGGAKMPVDYEPAVDGTLALTRQPGDEPPLARVLKASQRFGRNDLHLSHFATCPNADEHRRSKPKPTGRWLAANAPTDEPYPCRCDTARDGCRNKGAHCPCAGRTDIEHLPTVCCAKRAAQSTLETTT